MLLFVARPRPLSAAAILIAAAGFALLGSCSDHLATRPISDPRHLRCGADTCDTPGEYCCFESAVANGVPRCVKEDAPCSAPRIACDEIGDCSSDSTCCTRTSAIPSEGGTSEFEGTSCEPIAAAPCLVQANTTSFQVCKSDDECTNGHNCIVQRCQGRTVATCGKDPRCQP